jgi:trigger factor
VKVTTEELEQCEVLLTVEIEPDQQQNLLKKAAQRISREVKIPGFRPGKAPFNVVVRRFGMEAIQSEALEHSVEDMVKESMAQVSLVPYAQIQLDGVEWDPNLKIKIRVPTRPVVELGNYREIRLEAKTVEVTDQDVEDALKRLQEQNVTWVPVERPSEVGDLISMTVTEKDGETVLAEREAVEYELKPVDEEEHEAETEAEAEAEVAGEDEVEAEGEAESKKSSRLDLTTPLLGLSAGESKTFTVTYPEDFANEQYAGKDITFSVEVSAVKAKELDPVDDEFAQQVGDFETLDALKEKIREDIKQSRERMNNFELGSEALDKIIENAEKIEWPLALEEEQIDHEIEHYEQHLKQAGLTLDSALRVQNKTKDQLREETRESVVKQVKRGLVMSKLAELEQLQVNQVEILQQAKLMADMYGGNDQVWQSILASEAQQNTIANDLLSNKVIQRLAAIAKGEAPEPGAEEKLAETVSEAIQAEVTSEPSQLSAETEPDETVSKASLAEAAGEPSQLSAETEPDQAVDNAAAASTESQDKVENESTEEPVTTQV